MAGLDPVVFKVIQKCQKSPAFFINNFCQVKHPKLGMLPFKLFSYQKKCLSDFVNHKYNIFRKCRQCFIEGSMVWTPNGPKPIETLKKGDIVYSLDRNTNQLVSVPIGGVSDNGTSNECVEVRSKTGHHSTSTKDHKFLSYSGWIEAHKLTSKNRLIEVYDQARYDSSDHPSDPILLGYLLTDGGCNKNNLYFSNSNWKYLLEFQKHFKTRFDVQLKIKKDTSGFKPDSDKNYRISSSYIVGQKWLETYGLRGATGCNKKIPEQVFNWNNEDIALLLNRMFAGDGWYSGKHCNEVGIGQQSEYVLHQIKQLLSRFQISCKIYKSKSDAVHKLRIFGGKDFSRFVEQIGIFDKTPRCEITKKETFNRQKGELKSVKPIGGEFRVFDLFIPPHHNYIVDGTVVHNCGASTLTGSFALWYAMFYSNKTVLIVSKRDDDAKEYLTRNVKFVYNNLPDWMKELWKPEIINEHTIAFQNGSVIRSLTSSPDTLRSNASSLNIIDEAAFIDKMEDMWAGGFSTLQHGGCLAPDSYVLSEQGLIEIDKLHNVDSSCGEISLKVASDFGDGHAYKSFNNGVANTKKIVVDDGYNIEATLSHKFRIIKDGKYVWKKVCDLEIGDSMVLSSKCSDFGVEYYFNHDFYNNYDNGCKNCGKENNDDYCLSCLTTIRMLANKHNLLPEKLTAELAEFIGVLVGDGSIEKSGKSAGRFSISCDRKQSDYIEHLHDQISKIFNSKPRNEMSEKDFSVRFNNKAFMLMLSKNGFSKTNACKAYIPKFIMSGTKDIKCSFLRGYFEADGCISGNVVSVSSASYKLLHQAQVLLLSLGMRSRLKLSIRKSGFSEKDKWVLKLKTKQDSLKFKQLVGFISNWKQNRLKKLKITSRCHNDNFKDVVAIDELYKKSIGLPSKVRQDILAKKRKGSIPRVFMEQLVNEWPLLLDTILGKLVSNNLFVSRVVELNDSISKTYDISVKDHNTYIANGFVSHNSVIVISTPKGVGNWYWKTWADAIDKQNDFNPIIINWWDMDWKLEFKDELSGVKTIIAPTNDIKLLDTPREIEKYGPGPDGKTFWSPWLEGEYRNLATKGDDTKFRQEVLAEFIGSGNTVLSRQALSVINSTTVDEYMTIGQVDYVSPANGDRMIIDFQDQLRIWDKPYTQRDAEFAIAKAKEEGKDPRSLPLAVTRAHSYVIGADPSSGEADDFCAIQVLDVDTQEQVAELKIKALPKIFAKMIDYIGRMYNTAHVVCERTGIGQAVTQELDKDVMYPNLYRHRRTTANLKIRYNQIGFPTTGSTKPNLIKHLFDNIGEEDGYVIKSSRLYHEFCIFIHLGNNRYGNEPGTGNTDDLVMAMAMALEGIQSALMRSGTILIPLHNIDSGSSVLSVGSVASVKKPSNNPHLIAPVGVSSEMYTQKIDKSQEMAKFITQLGGIPLAKDKNGLKGKVDSVTSKKNILKYFRG